MPFTNVKGGGEGSRTGTLLIPDFDEMEKQLRQRQAKNEGEGMQLSPRWIALKKLLLVKSGKCKENMLEESEWNYALQTLYQYQKMLEQDRLVVDSRQAMPARTQTREHTQPHTHTHTHTRTHTYISHTHTHWPYRRTLLGSDP
jgi:hypothetical protein